MKKVTIEKSNSTKIAEEITITSEEENALRQIKTMRDLVFLHLKYWCSDQEKFKLTKNFSSWNELQKVNKKSDTSNTLDLQIECHAFAEQFESSYYKSLHEKIKLIKTIFNANKKIDFTNYEEAIFWYKLLIKMKLNSKIWNLITHAKNFERTGFIDIYKRLNHVNKRALLIEEIDFFMDDYKKIIEHQLGASMSNQCYRNMKDITQRDILGLLLFFDQMQDHVAKSLEEMQILSTEELLNSPDAIQLATDYRFYLREIFDNVNAAIKKVNQKYFGPPSSENSVEPSNENNDQETSLLGNSSEPKGSPTTKNHLDIYGEDAVIIRYLITELKELDFNYYRDLTMDNYEDLILKHPADLSDAVYKKRFEKIRDDLKTIICRSPKFLEYLMDHTSLCWDLDIILL